jgi:hypothetical protein
VLGAVYIDVFTFSSSLRPPGVIFVLVGILIAMPAVLSLYGITLKDRRGIELRL